MNKKYTEAEFLNFLLSESKTVSEVDSATWKLKLCWEMDFFLKSIKESSFRYSAFISRFNRNLTLSKTSFSPKDLKRPSRKARRMRLVVVTAVWRREDLTKIFYSYYSKIFSSLNSELEIFLLVAGSEGCSSRDLAEAYGAIYIEVGNSPLSVKWQATAECLRNIEFDAVLVVGSDDFLSESVFHTYKELYDRGANAVGFVDGHFYDTSSAELIFWRGYGAPKSANGMPDRVGESIGMGRMLSKEVLEALDYQIWSGEPINRGLDRRMKENLAKLGLLHVRYEDMKVGKFRDALPYSIVTLPSGDEHMLLDVKYETNVTKFKNYISNSETLCDSEKLIKKHFGEELFEGIKALPPV